MAFQRSSLLAKMLSLYLFATLVRDTFSTQTLPANNTLSPVSVFNGTASSSTGLPRPDLYLIVGFGSCFLIMGAAYMAGYTKEITAYCRSCCHRPAPETTPNNLEQPFERDDRGSVRSMGTV